MNTSELTKELESNRTTNDTERKHFMKTCKPVLRVLAVRLSTKSLINALHEEKTND